MQKLLRSWYVRKSAPHRHGVGDALSMLLRVLEDVCGLRWWWAGLPKGKLRVRADGNLQHIWAAPMSRAFWNEAGLGLIAPTHPPPPPPRCLLFCGAPLPLSPPSLPLSPSPSLPSPTPSLAPSSVYCRRGWCSGALPSVIASGIGEHFMRLLEVFGQKLQLQYCVLTVFNANVGAVRFYKGRLQYKVDVTSPEDSTLGYTILSRRLSRKPSS